MLLAVSTASTLLLPLLALLLGPPGESSAERLHRKGVHCMEEIERSECAIEHFEALLDERTDRRELITDGLLRLVKLYEKEDRPEDTKAALRRFWDAGKTDVRRGHLPYTVRFLPQDFDILVHAHLARLTAAPLAKQMDEVAEYVLTCDEDRRKQLDDVRLFRKAERKARETGVPVEKALSDVVEQEKKRAAARKKRAAERTKGSRRPEPVFADATCAAARALGDDSVAGWSRAAFAGAHADFRRSAAVLEIPNLAAKLDAGASAGRLRRLGDATFALVGHTYEGGEVHVATLETGELVVAPAGLLPEIIGNHGRGRRTLPRELDRLIRGVPIDSGFFAVVTEGAMRDLIGMGRKRRGLLQLLLPRPEGLQVAAVAHEYFGVFVRMPTDTPVKASALVAIAQRLIENQAEADPEAADFLRLLDVTQATDKRALLLSYVLSRRQLEVLALQ